MEDYNTYAEVDPNQHITIVGTNRVDFASYGGEAAYLYKDMGANFFSDFTHLLEVSNYAPATDKARAVNWMLANAVGDMSSLEQAGESLVAFRTYADPAGIVFELCEAYAGALYTVRSKVIKWNTKYYITITKIGASLICSIYDDKARTSLFDRVTLTLHKNHSFRYIYACSTYNVGRQDWFVNVTIENLELSPVVIRGVVSDATTGAPIEGVTVQCDNYQTTTDSAGLYEFAALPAGVYTLTFSKSGYQPYSETIDASAGGTYTVNAQLYPSPVAVEDNFNDGLLDTNLWRVFREGNVYERNGRVEVEPIEEAAGIRLRNRVDLRNFDLRVQRDPRKLQWDNWNQLTIGDSPTAVDRDWGCLTWSTDGYFYTVIVRWEWRLIYIRRSFLGNVVQIYEGGWSKPCAVMRVRIEPHPNYPGENRYLISFYEDEKLLVSEECTEFINAVNGLGVVELFSKIGLCAWDNFEIRSATAPAPTLYKVSIIQTGGGEGGIIFPDVGDYLYPADSQISLAAIPKEGFVFNGWLVNGVEYTEPLIILPLDSDLVVESKGFSLKPDYALLTIESTPINIPFTIDTTKSQTPFSGALPKGTYKITVPTYLTVGTVTYKFVQWEDGSTNPARTINLAADTTISVQYVETPTYLLTVKSTPIEGIKFELGRVA